MRLDRLYIAEDLDLSIKSSSIGHCPTSRVNRSSGQYRSCDAEYG
jgi:hypothetical protein